MPSSVVELREGDGAICWSSGLDPGVPQTRQHFRSSLSQSPHLGRASSHFFRLLPDVIIISLSRSPLLAYLCLHDMQPVLALLITVARRLGFPFGAVLSLM